MINWKWLIAGVAVYYLMINIIGMVIYYLLSNIFAIAPRSEYYDFAQVVISGFVAGFVVTYLRKLLEIKAAAINGMLAGFLGGILVSTILVKIILIDWQGGWMFDTVFMRIVTDVAVATIFGSIGGLSGVLVKRKVSKA